MHGVTNNPWNAAFSSGGSSGGAAAAVATGMTSFEVGTDQGSSIRWPAATNGIVGLKTSWGLVSSWGMVPPPPEKRTLRNVELAVVGPMARHAADLDLLLPILAGPRDPAVAAPVLRPPDDRPAWPARRRLARRAFAPVQRAVADGVRRAAALLASEGAIVHEMARPAFRFEEAYEVFALLNHWIVGYGLPAKVRDKIASAAASFAPGDLSHRALQARGMRMTPSLYQEVDQRRKRIVRQWAAFFERFDVVLMPCAPVAALAHDHEPNIMARTLDIDGVSVPYLNFCNGPRGRRRQSARRRRAVGLTADGMPLGVQIRRALPGGPHRHRRRGDAGGHQGGFRRRRSCPWPDRAAWRSAGGPANYIGSAQDRQNHAGGRAVRGVHAARRKSSAFPAGTPPPS